MDEDDRPLEEEELRALPVFPLPRTIFFPGTDLPLHVFENRYRRMIEDCLDDGPLAMAVALLRPGWEEDYEGRPPVHDVAGAGRIIAHERLADGRHNVVVRGLHRVRLEDLPPEGLPYRRAAAKILEPGGHASTAEVRTLLSCASAVVTVIRREHPEFDLDVSAADPPGQIVDAITDRLVVEPDLRQRLLETADVGERMRIVTDEVGELMALLSGRDAKKGEMLD